MTEITERVCRHVAIDKIEEVINNNSTYAAADLIYSIMLELVQSPQSVHPALTIDRTIDMACEEKFG